VRTRSASSTSPTSKPPRAEPGGWPAAGDYWFKYELGWHVSPTANQHDAIAAVELALAKEEPLAGRPLQELASRDADGNILPLITIVTDNGGPFRSFRFEAFIATHPELRHVRTRVRSPGQNGSRERGFGTLNYERLFLEEIDDVLDLTIHAERYRIDYNTVRPHEARQGRLAGGVRHPAGPGQRARFQAVFSLPMGVTPEMIADKRDVLARNLVRAPLEVWPSAAERAGYVDLWVADQGSTERPAPPYPLLHEGACDVFAGVPLGMSQRGDVIAPALPGANVAFGGVMGQGKSNAARVMMAGAALDPLAELWVLTRLRGPGTPHAAHAIARLHLAAGDAAAAEQSLAPISPARATVRQRVDDGIVRALIAARSDGGAALDPLEDALLAAAPFGMRRPFLVESAELRALLGDRIEAVTGVAAFAVDLLQRMSERHGRPPAAPAKLVDALTEREQVVLRYLASTLSNAEIASELYLSVNTVKTHQRMIYRKLGAAGRRDAVRRAKQLRIL
jgi:DNA-binding NarL/FixJ family response regulator